jgi:fructose-specific component phosphotransferase system IIB-like protein
MAFASANLTAEPRSWSVGPVKVQIKTISAASADVAGTCVFDNLAQVDAVSITGLVLTAQPTITGNSCVLAFVDPAATVAGLAIAFGR